MYQRLYQLTALLLNLLSFLRSPSPIYIFIFLQSTACTVRGVFGVNVIEPVGVVLESGLAHVLTPLRSLVALTAQPLGQIKRLNYAT